MKYVPFSNGDNGCISLKYKVKSDYLYKTEADILREFRGREGGEAGTKDQEMLEYLWEELA